MTDCEQFHTFFFFNDTATTEIYTLSLHDALPICVVRIHLARPPVSTPMLLGECHRGQRNNLIAVIHRIVDRRSEEHTSELQSQSNLVCRLLLEKKKSDSTDSTSRTCPSR